ncbi:MAG TPA: glycosyl hydrolase [Actinocrinis sp.]|uniref:glycoside hydrolase family 26 protein n=1 Tax=Actinocrinis sp. TaxID=1920516 RepID=UPI002DDD1366|nr:glycosyl hydrolase [Actinocrinis sp.]HEV3169544.1 glycosyl hydrolase [Actinocrinis sp.]
MASRRRSSRARLRVWTSVNLLILVVFTAWLFAAVQRSQAGGSAAGAGIKLASGAGGATNGPSAPQIPTKAQVLASAGQYFGISAPDAPWSAGAVSRIGTTAGVQPNMVEYFVNWSQAYSVVPVKAAYAEHALPVLTWEPFAGGTARNTNVKSPQYALSTIINGLHDTYIMQFATAVRDAKYPIAIRFAHEMNGDWYPWSEGVNGNTSTQFAQAWHHVFNIFKQVGATNVIWIWAPNVVRGAQSISLKELYPGDDYVDWIGLSAYDVTESTTAKLINPTMGQIRKFTAKPLLITEIGSQPSPTKTSWTEDFLSWLPKQSDVLGFVWFEYTQAQGAGTNWGFDADPNTLAAFRQGIKTVKLAAVPAS